MKRNVAAHTGNLEHGGARVSWQTGMVQDLILSFQTVLQFLDIDMAQFPVGRNGQGRGLTSPLTLGHG